MLSHTRFIGQKHDSRWDTQNQKVRVHIKGAVSDFKAKQVSRINILYAKIHSC